MENVTLFLSIPVTKEFTQNFMRYKKVRDTPDNVIWTPLENLHVTLLYIGSIPQADSVKLSQTLQGEFIKHAPFTITCSKVAQAPSPSVSHMVWAYFEGSDAFDDLVHGALQALCSVGFQPKDSYKTRHNGGIPHVTLARGEGCACVPTSGMQREATLEQTAIVVDEIQLLASVMGQGTRNYMCVETYSLEK